MDEDDLYDEFGNLIGNSAESGSGSELGFDGVRLGEDQDQMAIIDAEVGLLQRRFGDEVSASVVSLHDGVCDEPVLKPLKEKKMKVEFGRHTHDNATDTSYSKDYMISLMNELPERIRNVAVLGGFRSGKTTLLDIFIKQSHPNISSKNEFLRYLDNHHIELQRGISIKATPMTMLMSDFHERSYIFNFIDAPGHPNFHDELLSAILSSDGVLLVLDSVEGVTSRDKQIIREIMRNDLPITVVINKIDRLILELQLPPTDFYHKIRSTLDDLSSYMQRCEFAPLYHYLDSISVGSQVVFASSKFNFTFTLDTFSKMYLRNNSEVETAEFTQRLWGDVYYVTSTGKFTTESQSLKNPRTFTHFIAEPLYKIFTNTLTSECDSGNLSRLLWDNFSVRLPKEIYSSELNTLLKAVFENIFPDNAGVVSSMTSAIDSPNDFVAKKFEYLLGMPPVDDAELIGTIVKSIEASDGSFFYSLLRILQGVISENSEIRIVSEDYMDNPAAFKDEKVEELYLPCGQYKIPISQAGPGSLVLAKGINSASSGSAAFFSTNSNVMKPLNCPRYTDQSVYKFSIEPISPSDLPKMLASLRSLTRSYMSLVTQVEESGEYVILGPGELYLDCALMDLRLFFADNLEVKISDPSVRFSETCLNVSVARIPTKSNGNVISISAEPVGDEKLSYAIQNGTIDLGLPRKHNERLLRNEYGWDALEARSLWCFGPDDMTLPSMLLDDTLEIETDKKLLSSVKELICLGFKWGVNEGPLCDEPIRNTKFKILDAVLGSSETQRSNSQIIPLIRRACYAGLLSAAPRLMEPVYRVSVTCKNEAVPAISILLGKRRGYVIREIPIGGSPLTVVEGRLPVIDSVGLETDIRLRTQGQAMCFLTFENWNVVPGDPLDTNVSLPTLKPAPNRSLARDFVVKTRKRKGLAGEPSIEKYIDAELYEKLKTNGLI